MSRANPLASAPVVRLKFMWPFAIWLALFYVAWAILVVVGNHWGDILEHYGIAVAMAFGSYVAGSTPMGGGSVGFPILVLLFDEPATLGRDFSFAVQSAGMTSAAIFILCTRQKLEWVILRWALLGSVLGTPLGVLFLAPHTSGTLIKVAFAVTWASFGVLHLRRTRDICANIGETPAAHRFDRNVGFASGLLASGTVASVTGVGIDMVLYAVMVLLMRADLKVAIPSSVIVMAITSVVGTFTKLLTTGFVTDVYSNWLAAAPVVVLGAPLGALIVSRIGRRPTLYVVALLCVAQFVWVLQDSVDRLGWLGIGGAVGAVVALNAGFEWLWRLGDRLERRSMPMKLT